MRRIQHRHVLAAPFALIVVVAVIGGLVNSMDVRGRVTDEISGEPKKDTRIVHGSREVVSDENGEFFFPNLPRTSKVDIRPPRGYMLTSVLTTNAHEIKLHPLSVTVYAYDEAKDVQTGRVPNPQARDTANTKIIATGTESGQIIVAPHPKTEEGGRMSRLLICGEGFEPKEVEIQGVLMEVGLKAGGSGCPPLPTPTPDPNATPTPTPSPTTQPLPAPIPTPSPTRSP